MSNQCEETGTCATSAPETQCCDSSTECCDMPEKLLALADEAWHEVLKEKIRKEIEESCGEKLNDLARLVATANGQKWSHMIAGKAKCDQYKRSVKEFFYTCCDE